MASPWSKLHFDLQLSQPLLLSFSSHQSPHHSPSALSSPLLSLQFSILFPSLFCSCITPLSHTLFLELFPSTYFALSLSLPSVLVLVPAIFVAISPSIMNSLPLSLIHVLHHCLLPSPTFVHPFFVLISRHPLKSLYSLLFLN